MYMHWTDAADKAVDKIKCKYWATRLKDMFEGAANRGFGRYTELKVCRVNPDWPVKGSVTVESVDGAKYKLVLKKNKFVILKE